MPFLICDTETKPDITRLLTTCDWRGRLKGSNEEVAAKLMEELCANQKDPTNCFTPARYHTPVVATLLLVNNDMSYIQHAVVAGHDAKANTHKIWECLKTCREKYGSTLVTFNGLTFDMPMLEVNGLAHGADLSFWYEFDVKAWLDPRGAIAQTVHLDLYSFLAGKGRIGGDLSYWARLNGLPGKLDTNGAMVAEMIAKANNKAGLDQVIDYNLCDVLNTYGLLYRVLYTMRRVATDWDGPTFLSVAEKLTAGRGDETKKFMDLIHAHGVF